MTMKTMSSMKTNIILLVYCLILDVAHCPQSTAFKCRNTLLFNAENETENIWYWFHFWWLGFGIQVEIFVFRKHTRNSLHQLTRMIYFSFDFKLYTLLEFPVQNKIVGATAIPMIGIQSTPLRSAQISCKKMPIQ